MSWGWLSEHGRLGAYLSAGAAVLLLPYQFALHLFVSPSWPPEEQDALSVLLWALSILLLWLWIATLAVVALDLERRPERPIAPGRLQFARGAIAVALLIPLSIVAGQIQTSTVLLVTANFLMLAPVGVAMVVHNAEALPTGVRQNSVFRLGVLSGVGYIGSAFGYPVALIVWLAPDPLWTVFVAFFYVFLLA